MDCFFFEYFATPKNELSFNAGHCKLLELINNVPVAYVSGIESCRAVKNLHTSKKELNNIERRAFNQFYNLKKKLIEKLDNTEDEEEIWDAEFQLEELPKQIKKYLWAIKGWKKPKRWY